jgi:hypothetical protein
MRKVLIVAAIASLAFAGGLLAGSSTDKSTQAASKADAGIDIFSLSQSQSARDLPEQSYPAH